MAARGGVLDGVVDQVVDHLAQQQWHAKNNHGRPRGFKTEVDLTRQGTRHAVGGDLPRQGFEVDRFHGARLVVTGLGARQLQQLVGQVGSTIDTAIDVLQITAQLMVIGFPQREFDLGFQPGEGRFQLMGGRIDKALLGFEIVRQPRHHVVEGRDHRPHLIGRVLHADR